MSECGICGHPVGTCADCDFCDGFVHGLAAGRAEMTTEKQRERANIDAASIEVQQETIRNLKAELAALQKRIDDAPRFHGHPDSIKIAQTLLLWRQHPDDSPDVVCVALVPLETDASKEAPDVEMR